MVESKTSNSVIITHVAWLRLVGQGINNDQHTLYFPVAIIDTASYLRGNDIMRTDLCPLCKIRTVQKICGSFGEIVYNALREC
jgi:hypothetical protein